MAVDVHTHLVPKGWPDLAAVCGGDGWPWLRIDSERAAMIMIGSTEFRPIGPQAWDPAVRRTDMDADGIDLQVVSPTPVFFGYERPASQAVKLAEIFNDLTLETLAGDDRFVPFCQVPLQDPDLACAELDRCRAAGHAGVEIGDHVLIAPQAMIVPYQHIFASREALIAQQGGVQRRVVIEDDVYLGMSVRTLR